MPQADTTARPLTGLIFICCHHPSLRLWLQCTHVLKARPAVCACLTLTWQDGVIVFSPLNAYAVGGPGTVEE